MTSLNLCAKYLLKTQFALNFGDVMTSLNFWAKSLLKAQFALTFGDVTYAYVIAKGAAQAAVCTQIW